MTKKPASIAETQQSTQTNVNGEAITPFVPTQVELIHLVKYWVKKAIDDRYFIFWGQCFGSSDLRDIDFDWYRVEELAQILGSEETDKAVKKAYEEAAQDFEREDWIVFRYGTREERTEYQEKGGQCFCDFECGVAETIARNVLRRVFRDGPLEQQLALIKDELTRYARKLHSYKRGPRHVIEILGINFPGDLSSLVLNTVVDDPNPQQNDLVGTLALNRERPY